MQLPGTENTNKAVVNVELVSKQASKIEEVIEKNGSDELKGFAKSISDSTKDSRVTLSAIYDRLVKMGKISTAAPKSTRSASALDSPELQAQRKEEKAEDQREKRTTNMIRANQRRIHADNDKQMKISEEIKKVASDGIKFIGKTIVDNFNEQLRAFDRLADDLKSQNKSFGNVGKTLSHSISAAKEARNTYGIDLLPEQYSKAVSEIEKAGRGFSSLEGSARSSLLAISASGERLSREMVNRVSQMSESQRKAFTESVLTMRSGDNAYKLDEGVIDSMFSNSQLMNAIEDTKNLGKDRDEVLNQTLKGLYNVTNKGLSNSDLYLKMTTDLVGAGFNASRLASSNETKILYGLAQGVLNRQGKSESEVAQQLSTVEGILDVLNSSNLDNDQNFNAALAALEAGDKLSPETRYAIQEMIRNPDVKGLFSEEGEGLSEEVIKSYEQALIPKLSGRMSEILTSGRMASFLQSIIGRSVMSDLAQYVERGIGSAVSSYGPKLAMTLANKFPSMGKLLPAEVAYQRTVQADLATIVRMMGGRPLSDGGMVASSGSGGKSAKAAKGVKGGGLAKSVGGKALRVTGRAAGVAGIALGGYEIYQGLTQNVHTAGDEMTLSPEAVQKAYEDSKTRKKITDTTSAAISSAAGIGGAALGAKAGAALGSVIPGLGTLIGGVIGAAVGAGVGLALQSYQESKDIETAIVAYDALQKERSEIESQISSLDKEGASDADKALIEKLKLQLQNTENNLALAEEDIWNKRYQAADSDTKLLMEYKKNSAEYIEELSQRRDQLQAEADRLAVEGKDNSYIQKQADEANKLYEAEKLVELAITKQAAEINITSDSIEEFRKAALEGKLTLDDLRESNEDYNSALRYQQSEVARRRGDQYGGPLASAQQSVDLYHGARANGGLIEKPEVSLIGEDGTEAVLPLEKPSLVGKLMQSAQSLPIPQESKDLLAGGTRSIADNAIAYARDQRGKPYSVRSDGFVCNTLVQSAYRSAGMKDFPSGVVRTHWNNPRLHKVPVDSAVPGMIGFSNRSDKTGLPQHMGIITEDGKWINASGSSLTDYGSRTFVADPKSKGVVEAPMNKTAKWGMVAAGYYDGMFNDTEMSYIPKNTYSDPSGPTASGNMRVSGMMPVIRREVGPVSSILNPLLAKAWIMSMVDSLGKSSYGRQALSMNNPFRIEENGQLKSFESFDQGVQSYMDEISRQYSYMKKMMLTSQIAELRKHNEIGRSETRRILENQELKEAIERLTSEVRQNNQQNRKPNAHVVAPVNRRYV